LVYKVSLPGRPDKQKRFPAAFIYKYKERFEAGKEEKR